MTGEFSMYASLPRTRAVALAAVAACAASVQAAPPSWRTVVSVADTLPGSTLHFQSFGQPSINAAGLVVMRARSRSGASGEPLRGVYARAMGSVAGPAYAVFDNGSAVPGPNNAGEGGAPVTFTEFAAFARIGLFDDTIATRGQSEPLWVYTLPDGSETRVGTSGVYAVRRGQPLSVAGQFGGVPGLEVYAVPGAAPGTRFDQFPGAPAVGGLGRVAFKGNWTEGDVSKTGVFVRQAGARLSDAPTLPIATSDTVIPGQPEGGVRFGATAPPSAAGEQIAFLGVDSEESPTLGGIYLAPSQAWPMLTPVIRIGDPVPDDPSRTGVSRLGEALSYDGRVLAFWGSWGAETRQVLLTCPVDGNADLIAYCLSQYPDGHVVDVPLHQGVFVHDTRSGLTRAVAVTGAEVEDFLYWTFSGRPPGVGGGDGEDAEPPRWRSATFVAAQGVAGGAQLAFKAQRPGGGVDALLLATVGRRGVATQTLLQTGDPGTVVDPSAPAGATVTTFGVERDGLRNGRLVINAGMLDAVTGESWAGIYLTPTR